MLMLLFGILKMNPETNLFRYLYETANKKSVSWTNLSLIEWESNLEASKNTNDILKEAELKLSHSPLTDFTSPSSIVLFSSLYNILSSAKLSEYPALEKFFVAFL